MYTLASASELFALKLKNTFIASFYGRIVFGLVVNHSFEEDTSVVIDHFDYVDFYCSLITFLNHISLATYPTDKTTFLTHYFWQATSQNELFLVINRNSKETKLTFNCEAFQSLILCFANLIFSSLGLNNEEKFFLDKVSKAPIDDIIALRSYEKFNDFCKANDEPVIFRNIQTLDYYCDIIIIYKKLINIYKDTASNETLEKILGTF